MSRDLVPLEAEPPLSLVGRVAEVHARSRARAVREDRSAAWRDPQAQLALDRRRDIAERHRAQSNSEFGDLKFFGQRGSAVDEEVSSFNQQNEPDDDQYQIKENSQLAEIELKQE